jgi:excisionase family DNA binding protein
MKQEKYITLKRASEILGVTTQTLRNWDNSGKIKVIKTLGGHRRIPIEEIEKITGAVDSVIGQEKNV